MIIGSDTRWTAPRHHFRFMYLDSLGHELEPCAMVGIERSHLPLNRVSFLAKIELGFRLLNLRSVSGALGGLGCRRKAIWLGQVATKCLTSQISQFFSQLSRRLTINLGGPI